MKPLKLTIAGINSFVAERTVDFERLSEGGIFCICGPTGSGKTTVLDCVIIALYAPGKYHRGSLRDYVNTKSDRGKITLTFECDGKRYLVSREFRKTRETAKTKETVVQKASLECLDTGETLADKADTVTAKITEMLKLELKEFTKVVVLEQGRFAEFMQMGKTERYSTVAKLFELERFEQLKKTILAARTKYETACGKVAAALEQYDGVTEEALSEKKKELKTLEKKYDERIKEQSAAEAELKISESLHAAYARRASATETLAAAVAEEKKLAAEKEELARERTALAEREKKLREREEASAAANLVLARIEECKRDVSSVQEKKLRRDALRAEYKEADGTVKKIEASAAELSAEKARNAETIGKCEAEIEEAGYRAAGGTEADFAALKASAQADSARLLAAEKKREAVLIEIAQCGNLAEKLLACDAELSAKISEAAARLEESVRAYEKARLESEAAAVRSALRDGDECPVCGGKFHGGEFTHAADDSLLAALKAAEEEARKNLDKLKEDNSHNVTLQLNNNASLRKAKEALKECDSAIDGKNSESAAKAAKAAERAALAARKIAEAEKAVNLAAAQKASAEQKLATVLAEGNRLREEIEALEKSVKERLGGKEIEAAVAEAEAAVKAYRDDKSAFESAALALQKAESENSANLAAVKVRIEESQKTLATLPGGDFDEAAYESKKARAEQLKEETGNLRGEIGAAKSEKENLSERLARKKTLAEEKKKLSHKFERLHEFSAFVERDNKLFSYIAEGYVRSFTEAASETLATLTCGKYTLSYEGGEFFVIDFLAENAKRKVKTLSGGETFLASMSIAMAISRGIAKHNYEFFFLDEGFGTLHERAMETVSAALKELSRETVVGIVTHRSELADSIGVKLNVIPATEDEGSDFSVEGA